MRNWDWARICFAFPFALLFWCLFIPAAALLKIAMKVAGDGGGGGSGGCSFELFDVEIRVGRK